MQLRGDPAQATGDSAQPTGGPVQAGGDPVRLTAVPFQVIGGPMKDPRMDPGDKTMPFDVKKMVFGGFELLVGA